MLGRGFVAIVALATSPGLWRARSAHTPQQFSQTHRRTAGLPSKSATPAPEAAAAAAAAANAAGGGATCPGGALGEEWWGVGAPIAAAAETAGELLQGLSESMVLPGELPPGVAAQIEARLTEPASVAASETLPPPQSARAAPALLQIGFDTVTLPAGKSLRESGVNSTCLAKVGEPTAPARAAEAFGVALPTPRREEAIEEGIWCRQRGVEGVAGVSETAWILRGERGVAGMSASNLARNSFASSGFEFAACCNNS